MRICIAGAGITGCAAAMLLAEAGHDVTVFEAVPEVSELGVGINLLPHAISILDRLGLADQLEDLGVATAELVYTNRHGQRIWGEPRGRFAGYPVPQVSIHRGKLQVALFKAARARLGADKVQTGHRLVAVDDRSPVLVGADGIHSAVRAHFYPDEGPPKWQGILMWRGVTVGKPFLGGNTMVQAGHHNQKFVCYPISRVHADRGESLINWICDMHMGDQAMLPREDWNRPGKLEDFLPKFADWKFEWLDVPAVIKAAHAIYEFPMVDRDPLPRWSHGRITLLGDAAHPMYPIGSNGASQAILDGEAITQELTSGADPEAALQAYEKRRLPINARIVEGNRRKGIDIMLDIVEQRAPDGFTDLESVLPAAELEQIVGDYKKILMQDRDTLLALHRRQQEGA